MDLFTSALFYKKVIFPDYRCGSRFAWSQLFYYTTVPKRQTVLRAAIYGDMGTVNAQVWRITVYFVKGLN